MKEMNKCMEIYRMIEQRITVLCHFSTDAARDESEALISSRSALYDFLREHTP